MRLVMETFQVCSFSELNKEQQRKVTERLRDINVDYEWFEYTLEEMRKDLENLGFNKVVINFSGFHSQGDGASFTGNFDIPASKKEKSKRISLFKSECGIKVFSDLGEELMEHVFSKEDKDLGVSVERISHHYSHENTIDSDNDFVKSWSKRYSREIYRALENEYNHLTSDEAVVETIEANDYEFVLDTLEIFHGAA